jgi:hypothetical protein
MAETNAQGKRPEWMPTSEAMLSAWTRNNLLTMSSPSQFDTIAMLTARQIAAWLETQVVYVPARHCADACASVINRFIREGKGESG